MDVLFVTGLNNLVRGHKVESMMRDYDFMVKFAHHQAYKNHRESPNTCAIAKLYYPPQLCWFPDKGPVPQGFVDHRQDMLYLNREIERLNFESGIKVPNFPVLGVRSHKGKESHRYEHWREPDFRSMLHMADKERVKMGRQVNRFFEFETGN